MFALLASLIGVITGLATIVGWVASQSLEDTLASALPVAGFVYVAAWIAFRSCCFGTRFVGASGASLRSGLRRSRVQQSRSSCAPSESGRTTSTASQCWRREGRRNGT